MAAYQARVLVIANQTADAPELLAALQARQEKGPMVPTLLIPATRNGFAGKEEAGKRLEAGLNHWGAGGRSAQGVVGDPDPAVAVHETWDPRSFDEVIVSTLPGSTSKGLQSALPPRAQQITGGVVHDVEAGKKREPNYGPPPEKPRDELGLFRL